MKIDLSTIFVVMMVVIPELFAQRSRDLLIPRSLKPKGASEELAELAALGMATHRPVYLIDPSFKANRKAAYAPLLSDGVLLDLADVATLQIRWEDLSATESGGNP
jgi:hypothetical protein